MEGSTWRCSRCRTTKRAWTWWLLLSCATVARGVVLRSPTGRLVCGSTVVVDDGSRDTTFDGTNQMGDRRTFGSCSFPYMFGLHYTTSINQATATYAPLLPQRGCYLLEEWHPRVDCRVLSGVGGDKIVETEEPSEDLWTGYRARETNVELDSHGSCVSDRVRATVRGANSSIEEVYINQQTDGANWNPLLQMMFEPSGAEIELTSEGIACSGRACSSSSDPDCGRTQQDCHWIADAFRFVYIGNSCPSTPWPVNGQLNGCTVNGVNQGVEVAAMYDRRFSEMPTQDSMDSCTPDEEEIHSDESSSGGVPQEVLLWFLVAIGSGGVVLFAMYTIYAAALGHFSGSRRAQYGRYNGGTMHGQLPAQGHYPLQLEAPRSKPQNYVLVVGPDGQTQTVAVELEEGVQVEKKLSCSGTPLHVGDVDGISNGKMGRRKPRRTSHGSNAKVLSEEGEAEGGDGAEEGAEGGSSEEVEALQRRVQELEAANADLKGEAEDARYWKAALHRIQDEHMELRKEMELVREKKRYPGNGEETFRVRMEKAERALERERDMVKSLQRKIEAMEEQFRYVDATKERSSSNEERIRRLEDELEGAMTKLKQEQENNASLGLQIMDMESQRTVSGIDSQGISRELERLRQEYAEVQAVAEAAKMAKAEAEDAWKRAKEELIVLQEERESLTAKLDSVQGTMEKLLHLNDELTEQVNRKQCDIDELVNHLAQISQDSMELGVEEGTTPLASEEEDVDASQSDKQDREVVQAPTQNEEHEPGTLESDGSAESTTPHQIPNAGEETEPFLTVPVAEMPPDRFVMNREGDAKIQPGSPSQKSGIWNYITGADRVNVDLNK